MDSLAPPLSNKTAAPPLFRPNKRMEEAAGRPSRKPESSGANLAIMTRNGNRSWLPIARLPHFTCNR